jgi:chromosome condensin MukBEF ATPase and DNA-binding subunit MukB
MEQLRHELDKLIAKLAPHRPAADSQEGRALQYLQTIQKLALGKARSAERAAAFVALRQFWLHSIAWCSALSRDIEKLIIIYEESSAADHPDPADRR